VDDVTAVEARTLLAHAFADDPLMRWFFPDDDARLHACAALFGLFGEQYLAAGRVDVVRRDRPVAVAMWRWPGTAAVDQPETLPTPQGLMTGLLGPARAAEAGAVMRAIADLRPTEPYAYLHLLGVDPAARGQGIGGEVLERGLGAARREGLAARLETMNPVNVPFYEAHGFSVRHELPLAAGGPTVWAMST
jgi:ribosomal protein S18 acetylase RimI-like enzyme